MCVCVCLLKIFGIVNELCISVDAKTLMKRQLLQSLTYFCSKSTCLIDLISPKLCCPLRSKQAKESSLLL